MQTTLRIDDAVYREAKAEAAREGITLTRFIEEALRLRIESGGERNQEERRSIDERKELMEGLVRATARYRIGTKPTREETAIYLPEEMRAGLERISQAEGRSEADVIREALERAIDERTAPGPTLPLCAQELGDPTASERVDELLEGYGRQ